MQLEKVYENLLFDSSKTFVQTENGELLTFESWAVGFGGLEINIFPGSFNPLHDAHRAIYGSFADEETLALFELSINRFDKPVLSLEDLKNRLDQFVGYAPVLITNLAKFSEKCGVVCRYFTVKFHVGLDTIQRLLAHSSKLEIQALNCEFLIYDRVVESNPPNKIPKSELPYNCFYGHDLPDDLKGLSSTAIRNKL